MPSASAWNATNPSAATAAGSSTDADSIHAMRSNGRPARARSRSGRSASVARPSAAVKRLDVKNGNARPVTQCTLVQHDFGARVRDAKPSACQRHWRNATYADPPPGRCRAKSGASHRRGPQALSLGPRIGWDGASGRAARACVWPDASDRTALSHAAMTKSPKQSVPWLRRADECDRRPRPQ
jgi:hypothetical protein